ALRDLLIISGVIMSFMFFFPDVVITDNLPLTGGLAAASLFGVLLVKLIGDPDHNLRDFRIATILLGIGAIFYFVPYVLGVEFYNETRSSRNRDHQCARPGRLTVDGGHHCRLLTCPVDHDPHAAPGATLRAAYSASLRTAPRR